MNVVQFRSLLLPALIGTLAVACEKRDPLAPSFAVSKAGALAAPSNLSLTVDSYHQIWFAWQDNATNESGYEVWKSTTGPSGAFSLFTTYPWPNTAAGGNDGLAPSTQYCYKVRAYSTQGQSGKIGVYSNFSDTACATTPAAAPPPTSVSAPSELSATPTISWAVTIRWTDNATNEDGFHVERAPTNSGPWEAVITLLYPNASDTYDGSRTPEQQTCYRVFAFNGQGSSAPSNVDCTTPPAAPTNLAATAVDAGTIDLAWKDNSGFEDGYEVLRSTDASNFSTVATLPASITMYRDAVAANVTYAYMVRATKDGGFSSLSSVANAVGGLLTPPTPPGLYPPEGYFLGTIWLYWGDGSNNQEGYKIERCSGTNCSDADFVVIAATGATVRSYQDMVGPGDVVSYRIRATNRVGDSAPSNVAVGRSCDEAVDYEAPCVP